MAWSTAKHIFIKYPLTKGIAAYSITWPVGNIIQQTMDGKRFGTKKRTKFIHSFHHNPLKSIYSSTETYDWKKCLQFALYGSLYVAPSLYAWVKLTSKIWPVSNARTAIMKTVVEQLSYGPFAIATFFFIMSMMEHKTVAESKAEVADKFWPTYKVTFIHLFIHKPNSTFFTSS